MSLLHGRSGTGPRRRRSPAGLSGGALGTNARVEMELVTPSALGFRKQPIEDRSAVAVPPRLLDGRQVAVDKSSTFETAPERAARTAARCPSSTSTAAARASTSAPTATATLQPRVGLLPDPRARPGQPRQRRLRPLITRAKRARWLRRVGRVAARYRRRPRSAHGNAAGNCRRLAGQLGLIQRFGSSGSSTQAIGPPRLKSGLLNCLRGKPRPRQR